MKRIAILGCGLIGGSFALGLKARGFTGEIIAHDRPEVLEAARKLGAVDRAEAGLGKAVEGAELVVVATPVLAILDLLSQLAPVVRPGVLITDTGSTKVRVCQHAAQTLPQEVDFLGGHPMAGRAEGGIGNATPDLFRGSKWIVTPGREEDLERPAAKFLLDWVRKLGAEPVTMTPDEHDEAVAWISHLPQLLSTGLASVVAEATGADGVPATLAGAGFRDMVRLASSPYDVWRDVCLTNGENLRRALSRMEQELAHLRERLGERDLAREFNTARKLVEEFKLGRKNDG